MAGIRLNMVLLSSMPRSWGGYDLIFGARDEVSTGELSLVRGLTGDLRVSIGNPTLAQRFQIGKLYAIDVSEIEDKKPEPS